MPYITQERREKLKNIIDNVSSEIYSIGDVNYMITMIIKHYINLNGINYSTLNQAIGVFECAKLELYRRLTSVYEDKKIQDNGDVYNSN